MYRIEFKTPAESYRCLASQLLSHSVPVQRSSWQSITAPSPAHELTNVVVRFNVPDSVSQWQNECDPDLPWAEKHFKERVSGSPLNPPPSYVEWPWHSRQEAERFIKSGGKFDHTYPERYWPKDGKYAGDDCSNWGDLEDVAKLLRRDPWSRQAFLPVWFPEDTGVRQQQRVPCSLGYHFIRNKTQLDCNYFIRSCDITRHYKNDIYLTGRLLQWMVDKICKEGYPYPGEVTAFISNLHLFTQDAWRFK
jgi:thymidylate synthase